MIVALSNSPSTRNSYFKREKEVMPYFRGQLTNLSATSMATCDEAVIPQAQCDVRTITVRTRGISYRKIENNKTRLATNWELGFNLTRKAENFSQQSSNNNQYLGIRCHFNLFHLKNQTLCHRKALLRSVIETCSGRVWVAVRFSRCLWSPFIPQHRATRTADGLGKLISCSLMYQKLPWGWHYSAKAY